MSSVSKGLVVFQRPAEWVALIQGRSDLMATGATEVEAREALDELIAIDLVARHATVLDRLADL